MNEEQIEQLRERFTEQQVEAILLALRQRAEGDDDTVTSEELHERIMKRYGVKIFDSV